MEGTVIAILIGMPGGRTLDDERVNTAECSGIACRVQCLEIILHRYLFLWFTVYDLENTGHAWAWDGPLRGGRQRLREGVDRP